MAAWPVVGDGVYSGWRELEAALATLVRGHRIAMEYSPGDAVPYVDRVPAGVIEMVRRRRGRGVVGGAGQPVLRGLEPENTAAHRRAAEAIANRARRVPAWSASRRPRRRSPSTPSSRGSASSQPRGTGDRDAPIVAIGPNAANPHYGR